MWKLKDFMDAETQAQKRCEIATAKLLVAENLRLLVAIPWAYAIYVEFESGIASIVIGIVTFSLVTYWYEKEYDAANDEYDRLTGTGKYWTG